MPAGAGNTVHYIHISLALLAASCYAQGVDATLKLSPQACSSTVLAVLQGGTLPSTAVRSWTV